MLTTEQFNASSEEIQLQMLSDSRRISDMLLSDQYACWHYQFEGILIEVRCEVQWGWPIVEVVGVGEVG